MQAGFQRQYGFENVNHKFSIAYMFNDNTVDILG